MFYFAISMWLRLKLIRANTMPIRKWLFSSFPFCALIFSLVLLVCFFVVVGENVLFFGRDTIRKFKSNVFWCVRLTNKITNWTYTLPLQCHMCIATRSNSYPIHCVQFKSNETVVFVSSFVGLPFSIQCISNLKPENMTDADLMNQRIVHNLLNKWD